MTDQLHTGCGESATKDLTFEVHDLAIMLWEVCRKQRSKESHVYLIEAIRINMSDQASKQGTPACELARALRPRPIKGSTEQSSSSKAGRAGQGALGLSAPPPAGPNAAGVRSHVVRADGFPSPL